MGVGIIEGGLGRVEVLFKISKGPGGDQSFEVENGGVNARQC
jgi:hypothetical protein